MDGTDGKWLTSRNTAATVLRVLLLGQSPEELPFPLPMIDNFDGRGMELTTSNIDRTGNGTHDLKY